MNHSRLSLLISVCIIFTGCGSPINENNYDRIETGMAEMEVINILGEPTGSSDITVGPVSTTSSVWEGNQAQIAIQFVNGRVKIKNFTAREKQ
jgi:hypothetical protein